MELKIQNGEFATLVSVSNSKFIAETDRGGEVFFNPKHISLKHGYASTVYKAQGASIKNVYYPADGSNLHLQVEKL